MYESIVNKNDGVDIFSDEDCMNNGEEGEYSIPSKNTWIRNLA